MDLECLNGIITDNLAVHIDLTNLKSWDLNTGFTSVSLNKWSNAVSDNINLIDFGLTGFDNGRTNVMWNGISIKPTDTLFTMYRVGYNMINNPSTGQTSGLTITTQHDLYPISGITTGATGNYFELNGGYLQGFFKLEDFNYELLPARYNNGITIETLLYLYPESQGIFLMMGARAEDKYNPFFSGETMTGMTVTSEQIGKASEIRAGRWVGATTETTEEFTVDGVTTSFDNYLDAILEGEKLKEGFSVYEEMKETSYLKSNPVENIKNNAIAFEITEDKKIIYKFINENGLIITNISPISISSTTGWTFISITFTPDTIIDDPDLLECAKQRTGKLVFYINGRAFWTIKEFPEFYFHGFENDKEKQIGVPHSISWGGGSFGLKHSWHYDFQTYGLYTGQDTNYLETTFFVEPDPIQTECYSPPTGNTYLAGLSLSADSETFTAVDECNPNVEHPITVMRIEHTGNTATTYYIKYNQPISALSNRNYAVNLSLYDDRFFNWLYENKVSILVYSDTTDVHIIDNVDYIGDSGWENLKTIFRTEDNSGQHFVNIGILIETDGSFNTNNPLFIKDFTYRAADMLTQDPDKENLLIQQNFDSSFIGKIQKLRIYDKAFTSNQILHNALIESQSNPNIVVSKGGRIIYR